MAYPKQSYLTVRALWETGRFSSAEKLHEAAKITVKPCPSLDSIRRKMLSEGWVRGERARELGEKTRDAIEDVFVELGMPRKEIISRVIKGIKIPDEITEKVFELMRAKIGDDEDTTAISKEMVETIRQMTGLHKHSLEYIKMAIDLMGIKAPQKHKVDHTSKGKRIANWTENMSTAELEKAITVRMEALQKTGAFNGKA